MIKRYDERMLNLLLDRYERSQMYTGENTHSQSISVGIQKRNFPEYFEESSLQYEIVHQQIMDLEQKGFLTLQWKNKKQGHILEKCVLNLEQLDSVYAYLHRRKKSAKEDIILSICKEMYGAGVVLSRFLSWIVERLAAGESVKRYCDLNDPAGFRILCRTISYIEENREEIFLREFSIRYFHDSKEAEKWTTLAVSVLKQFSENAVLSDLTREEVLEEYRIFKNPSWIYLKGTSAFILEDSENPVDVLAFVGGLGIASNEIVGIQWQIKPRPNYIITIENLTSFHRWSNRDGLAVYLGGYHNQSKREFLQKLYQVYGAQIPYYHFGDIDVGGFRIWKNLCERTGISFLPYKMDLNTLKQYETYGRTLTKHDEKELKIMGQEEFYREQWEVFRWMLAHGIKLEQECILE